MFENHRNLLYKAIGDDCAFLKGGSLLQKYASDEEYIFQQEATFFYYTGCNEEDAMAVFDGKNKKSYLFILDRGEEYALWFGYVLSLQEIQKEYPNIEVHYLKDFDEIISKFADRKFHVIRDIPTIKNQENVPNEVNDLRNIAACHRIIKDEHEIEKLTQSCKANATAFEYVMSMFKQGMSEREAEALYKFSLGKSGIRKVGFECIMPTGKSTSIFDYESTNKVPVEGENFLMDCGCLFENYCSDTTRMFPVGKRFTKKEEELYNIVMKAQDHALTFCKAGANWVDIHFETQREILRGLREIGMVNKEGDFEEQMKAGVPAVFLVHGLGHHLGLGTCHDVVREGDLDAKKSGDPRIKYLRFCNKLEAGMCLTVEPGIYFIKPLIDEALKNPEEAKHLNTAKIAEYAECGGFRLEDDIIITADGYHMLPTPVRDLESIYRLRDLAYAK